MNLHTFKDIFSSKRSSLINEVDIEDDEDHEARELRGVVEGEEEEDEGREKFNEVGEVLEPFNLKYHQQYVTITL